MTDETKDTAAAQPPVDTVVAVAGDDAGIEAVAGIAVQGNQALLVAQFADMDSAKNAYYALVDAEAKRAIDIQGVLVANADYQGKIHIQKMTDHTTRTGLKWGLIGGAIIGLIFPPTIIAGAVGAGIAGAAVGKAGNVLKKSAVADELAPVIAPGTSGIVALVAITAVDAVTQTIPDAKVVKSAPVDAETAARRREGRQGVPETRPRADRDTYGGGARSPGPDARAPRLPFDATDDIEVLMDERRRRRRQPGRGGWSSCRSTASTPSPMASSPSPSPCSPSS